LVIGTAKAQTYEFGILGGYARMTHMGLGSVSPENGSEGDTRIKADYTEGVWITANTRGYYGQEISYLMTRFGVHSTVRNTVDTVTTTSILEDRTAVRQLNYNFLIYFMPRGERWRPFVTGGAQAYEYHAPDIANWTSGSARHYGANWGGGVKLALFPHALMRFDFRDYIGGKPYKLNLQTGGWIHQLEGTVGLGFTF
jgi:hypothetical protein